MILFRAAAIFTSSISKFGEFFPATDREVFRFSKESTISTSLIHTIASDGQSEQVVTWFLNRIFQTKNDWGLGNLSNCNSDISCRCCPTIEFCWKSTSVTEPIHSRRPSCKCRHWNCVSLLFVISCEKSPRPCSLWNWSSFSLWCARVNSLMMILGRIKCRKLITKNVFL